MQDNLKFPINTYSLMLSKLNTLMDNTMKDIKLKFNTGI
ncbi:unnamed protein product [Schistosoma mattheei]|uniref:Uncharacterized protein n=1 Tax=Schistosoma mattheei TaxID=31246 RepID=A0A183Q2M5_9TREM|nr:unnamed protein product [Schistosoma mattheei]